MNRKFLLLIAGLLLLVFIAEYRVPRHFSWTPTYDHRSSQPFGCMVMDSLLAESFPLGYTVTRQSLWQLQRDSAFMATPHAVIAIGQADGGTARQSLELAKQGHVVLLAGDDMLYGLADTLGIDLSWHDFFYFKTFVANTDYDTLVWQQDNRQFFLKTEMTSHTMTLGDSLELIPLLTCGDDAVAAAFRVGRGEIIMLSAPLLLTNYGMLSDDVRPIVGRQMGRLKHLPVVRTEAYLGTAAHAEQSPFYVLLQRPPLRWALYIAVLTILCLMVFTARRRQRAIPVVEPPRNANLELVELVGTLAWQQADHRGLVERKLRYASEEARRLTGIDLLTTDADEQAQLARLAGLSRDELRLRIANAREATTGHHVVTPEEMRVHVDNLNEIINQLK